MLASNILTYKDTKEPLEIKKEYYPNTKSFTASQDAENPPYFQTNTNLCKTEKQSMVVMFVNIVDL